MKNPLNPYKRITLAWLRKVVCLSLVLSGLLLMTLDVDAMNLAEIRQQDEEQPVVYVLTFEGAVTPVLGQYIQDAIDAASVATNVEAVVLQLDTPGGSVSITQDINQSILASPVPMVVFVSPEGSHAGSAGTFITLAAHVAAMAPSTSIGAASPVGGDGADIGDTMEAKVTNILSADIENLASRRGEEATEWAIAAVQEARAATAEQALELGVIDFIADDVTDLLEQIDGFAVEVRGQELELNTADAFVITRDLNPIQELLNFIANPAIASLLLSLGSLGLIFEIRSPGFGVPGIVGAIALLLGLYALGQLEANFAGLGLIGLALILFAAEAFTPTFGALALGGMAAFIFGAALLFDSPGVEVPWTTIILLAVLMGGFTFWAGGMGLAAQNRPAMTGMEGLIGQTGRVRVPFNAGESGSVLVAGEWWNAKLADGTSESGEQVKVVDQKGYTLIVTADT